VREIRFRGKRVDNGEWVYGLLSFASKTTSVIKRDADGIPVAVDSKTVGEWTGRKDANGKDIYEGDVFSDGSTCIFVGGKFVKVWKDGSCEDLDPTESQDEVVGNIHDNPELLEGSHAD
jgi:uncharacterized phage protein (TIGR01671 family)